MAELTRRQLCEDTVTLSEITKWPQEYQDKIKNMLSYPLDEYVNLYYNHDPIVGEGFECSAECSAGEKLADCVKRNEQSEECTKILAAQHIKIKFEPQFQAELCGHIPKNAKSTFDDSLYGSSIEYWQRDKEKNHRAFASWRRVCNIGQQILTDDMLCVTEHMSKYDKLN